MKQSQKSIVYVSFVFFALLTLGFLGLGVWSAFGNLEESVPGVGEMVPMGKYRTIRSPINGVVIKVYVTENQVVRKGQVLFELDTEGTRIDQGRSQGELSLIRQEAAALQAATTGQERGGRLPSGTSGEWLNATRQSYESKLRASHLQVEEAQHRVQEALQRSKKMQTLLETNEALLKKYKALYQEGGLSELEYKDFEKKVIDQRGDLSTIAEEIQARQMFLAKSREDIGHVKGSYQETLLNRLTQLEKDVVSLSHDVERNELTRKLQVVTSPIDGIIHEQKVRGPGDVVGAGEDLLSIVPQDATLVAEVKITNQDLAYIHPGQRAALRFDAFPIQKFERIFGVVESISPSSTHDEEGHIFYLARVKPDAQSVVDNRGKQYPLRAGMSVNTDIITREKSILSFFTEPLQVKVDRAFRDPSNKS
ncbi:MAG: HlyD family type I secretion periplasmic adaptor subunit [Candidatus Melainabacteria bacterium]|nr:HlyD family type I secretion periplasmic adaptor subunit [Candidatus Melainabacteria bacterium]